MEEVLCFTLQRSPLCDEKTRQSPEEWRHQIRIWTKMSTFSQFILIVDQWSQQFAYVSFLSPHNTLRNLFIISFFLLCCFLLFVEFSIITENKTYFFAAKNMQEKENWIHDLETVIKCSPKWLGIYYLRPNQTNICINFVVVVVEWVMICVGRYIVHIPLNKGTWNSESRDGFFRVMFSHLP